MYLGGSLFPPIILAVIIGIMFGWEIGFGVGFLIGGISLLTTGQTIWGIVCLVSAGIFAFDSLRRIRKITLHNR